MVSVLIYDDSAFVRSVLSGHLKRMRNLEVAGVAEDLEDAVSLIEETSPDVMTYHVGMLQKKEHDIFSQFSSLAHLPAILLLADPRPEDGIFCDMALEKGADDFLILPPNKSRIEDVMPAFAEKVFRLAYLSGTPEKRRSIGYPAQELVVIGCGEGGCEQTENLLAAYHPDARTAVLVVPDHLPCGFSRPFARRLGRMTAAPVSPTEEGQILCGGEVYVCTAGFVPLLKRNDDGAVIVTHPSLSDVPEGILPVDVGFASAAEQVGDQVTAVLLSGKGIDGNEGSKVVYGAGGTLLAIDPESCKYDEMVSSARIYGALTDCIKEEDLAGEIVRRLKKKRQNHSQ